VRLVAGFSKVNPQFYPEPLDPPQQMSDGSRHFPRPSDGFMTQDEFVSFYDSCAEALHIRNPFREGDPTIHIGYSVEQWVARIQRLLSWHLMHLVNGTVWIVKIPAEGDVQAWPAAPND
jgi:hypothetical protein